MLRLVIRYRQKTHHNQTQHFSYTTRDDRGADDVWAVIYPPSYIPPESGTELIDEDLDMILLDHKSDNIYRGRYSNFNEVGTYRIVLHADDGDRLMARPMTLAFTRFELRDFHTDTDKH